MGYGLWVMGYGLWAARTPESIFCKASRILGSRVYVFHPRLAAVSAHTLLLKGPPRTLECLVLVMCFERLAASGKFERLAASGCRVWVSGCRV